MTDASTDKFKAQILDVFSEKSPEPYLPPYMAIKDIVITMRDQGYSQNDVYACLEGLRKSASSEAQEDVLLEVMDLVVGFCRPEKAIF